MKYLYGSAIFIWIIVDAVIKNIDFVSTGCVLLALCLFIVKEKFLDRWEASLVYGLALGFLMLQHQILFLLFAVVILDLAYFKKYPLSGLVLAGVIAFAVVTMMAGSLFPHVGGAVFGFAAGYWSDRQQVLTSLLDKERRLRYQLEKTNSEMLAMKNQIEHFTEIKERNRIAQEIHDSIGHGIAGVLLQLRAAERVITHDAVKAEEVIRTCTSKLAETLETTRKTVYNIRSDQHTGIEYFQQIVQGFKFCPVEFKHTGDFSELSTSNLKALEATLKEALTNAMKYSKATRIEINLDIKKKWVRFYYKDNGVGCKKIIENVGLSSMKERVKNLGGTYSVDGNDGFMIVCTLPNNKMEA